MLPGVFTTAIDAATNDVMIGVYLGFGMWFLGFVPALGKSLLTGGIEKI